MYTSFPLDELGLSSTSEIYNLIPDSNIGDISTKEWFKFDKLLNSYGIENMTQIF